MAGKFVNVYAKASGKKHRVPAHYLDNPVLAAPFRKTPSQRAADTAALGSATPATDVVTAPPVTDPPTPSTPRNDPPTTETPAAGAKE